ncbi:MAG: DUF58 domain-containing protein [Actinomycetota bacterium]|nr:DUF58 domain-containing protein [Actinomycetota bacterium]
MPTSRGWLVAATGLGLFVAGELLGVTALSAMGLALVALAAAAVAVVRFGRHELETIRSVAPQRVGAGHPITVRIRLTNIGRATTPLLLLDDRIPAGLTGRARFAFAGVEPDGVRSAAYEIRPPRRGRYQIGPLEIVCTDPFGLANVTLHAQDTTSILVYPRIETLALPRDHGERRSLSVSALRQPTGMTGEDFYTLREYVEGDDLRKIHWPSTAKRARYMIRQEETPWHTRATLLMDDDAVAHDSVAGSSSFERCAEATASLVDLYHRAGYTFRLLCSHEPGVAASRGTDHLNRCLDLLATVQPIRTTGQPTALLTRFAELEAQGSAEGTLVFVGGSIDARVAMGLSRCRRRYRQVIAVSFPAHRFGTASTKDRWAGEQQLVETIRLLTQAGIRTVVLSPGEAVATGWAGLTQVRPQKGGGEWDRKPELV